MEFSRFAGVSDMKNLKHFVIVIGVLMLFVQCRKEKFTDDPSAKLEFSADTLLFDTVFNTVGSTTARLTVYNRNNQPVIVSAIAIEGGSGSQYRMNVNGLPGHSFESVEIGGKDSIFVFVEVTVDPADSLHPFVEDKIAFVTNGNQQKVNLLAWGWDAVFYTPNTYPTNGLPPYRIINTTPGSTTTWTKDKPIVIYGYAVVDEFTKLVIEAGTKIYLHEGSGLWVYQNASIEVNGTLEEPVIFQGDRLEQFYQDQPGQWDRIWINEGSDDNIFRHTIIRNSFVGIQAETLPFSGNENAPTSSNTLILENCRIYNTSVMGLFARNYRIQAENSLFYNSGQYLLAVSGGGEYDFNLCTFANYWTFSNRQDPLLLMTNVYQNPPGVLRVKHIESTLFSNCIFYGNNDHEMDLSFNLTDVDPMEIEFRNSIVKYDTDEEDYSQYFGNSVYVNEFPGFKNTFEQDFRLSSGAFAIDKGVNDPGPPFIPSSLIDLDGNSREGLPDIGCFEYVP